MSKKPWRKILYENQNYADSYVDEKVFLRELKKNIDFKEVSIVEAVFGASLLVQEICSIIVFVLIYFFILNNWIEPSTILKCSNSVTVVGFLLYLFVFSRKIKEKIGHDLRTVLTFLVFGQLFSPVLHTLTDTISTDTIYTMSFLMMIVHLIFFDYGVSAAIVSKSLSLSAAVFASICLASRLSSAYETFILMTVSTEIFVLFPILRNELGNHFVLTLVLFFGDIFCLMQISTLLSVLLVLTVIFLNVVCPVLFVKYQLYKENIYGPWDEAVVDDVDNLFIN